MKRKENRQHYQSLFVKSVAALILIGIVPLLIMGLQILYGLPETDPSLQYVPKCPLCGEKCGGYVSGDGGDYKIFL